MRGRCVISWRVRLSFPFGTNDAIGMFPLPVFRLVDKSLDRAVIVFVHHATTAFPHFLYGFIAYHRVSSMYNCSGVMICGVSNPNRILILRICATLFALARCKQFQVNRKSIA